MVSSLLYHQHRHHWRLSVQRFFQIFRLLNQRAELQRLIAWATRKKLPDPRRAYQRRLAEVEMRLADYTLRTRRLVWWARLLHTLCHPTNIPPKNLRKGMASGYRRSK